MYNIEKITEKLRSSYEIRIIVSKEDRTQLAEDLASKGFTWNSGRCLTDKGHRFYTHVPEFKWYNFRICRNQTCTWNGENGEPTAMSDEEVYMAEDFLTEPVQINNDLFFQLISS